MKILLTVLIVLSSFSALATSIECYQGDGDDRYDLKFQDGLMAIIHTNDSDESELAYYDTARHYSGSRTISAGRYIVKLSKDLDDDSVLYKLEGRNKVELTDILECQNDQETGINKWVNDNLND